jgi:hypothetical protein
MSNSDSNEKKVFYCEICDHVSPKLSQYLTHERSSGHIQGCLKYRQEITSDKKQLEAMSKIMNEKMGLKTNNINELVYQIVALMSKQRLTDIQVKEARERKKEKEKKV